MTTQAVERVKALVVTVDGCPWLSLTEAMLEPYGPGGKQLLAADIRAILEERERLVETIINYRQGVREAFDALCPTCRGSAVLPPDPARSALTGEGRNE